MQTCWSVSRSQDFEFHFTSSGRALIRAGAQQLRACLPIKHQNRTALKEVSRKDDGGAVQSGRGRRASGDRTCTSLEAYPWPRNPVHTPRLRTRFPAHTPGTHPHGKTAVLRCSISGLSAPAAPPLRSPLAHCGSRPVCALHVRVKGVRSE